MTDFGSPAGDSTSGEAEGGNGDGKGPGGNAYSGFAGPSRGGAVVNEGGIVDNTGATSKYRYIVTDEYLIKHFLDIGGDGASSTSGDSQGGDAA